MDKIAKAIVAGLTAGAGALGTALADGQVTGTEYVFAAVAVIVGFFGVWATTNAPTVPPR